MTTLCSEQLLVLSALGSWPITFLRCWALTADGSRPVRQCVCISLHLVTTLLGYEDAASQQLHPIVVYLALWFDTPRISVPNVIHTTKIHSSEMEVLVLPSLTLYLVYLYKLIDVHYECGCWTLLRIAPWIFTEATVVVKVFEILKCDSNCQTS